ncbi:hypothetical protein DPMN_189262 [Dreissena polymorpha]|uniref:Uncharacterized protein n=1 Tax=Dreissena polymorpha TaxID=45954 RepID=A0A9D4IAV1_DREPO|nr:hypothetical protein DPMN_189262 [Dreissena polymorpha]
MCHMPSDKLQTNQRVRSVNKEQSCPANETTNYCVTLQRSAKLLIRLSECTGWSGATLAAYGIQPIFA